MSLIIDGAASNNGTVLLNGGITGDLISQLQKLCPDADFLVWDDGEVKPTDASFCEEIVDANPPKETCKCLCQLINSDNTWTVLGVKMDPGGTVWPNTDPDDGAKGNAQANGNPTPGGTGGKIYSPTTDSKSEFGAYDPKGNKVWVSEEVILGHELCGHAAHMDRGDHDPRPQFKGNRPGHDQAIDEENKVRRDLGLKTRRGKFNDPNKGESFKRPKKK